MSAEEALLTAALLDDRAGRLDGTADMLAARFASAAWSGPAADRFRVLMVQRRNEMRAAADALREVAHALRVGAAQ